MAFEGANPWTGTAVATLTTNDCYLTAIAWLGSEAASRDIAATDDFAVTDGGDFVIIEKRAIAAGDDLVITFPQPLLCHGVKISKIDGGVYYVFRA